MVSDERVIKGSDMGSAIPARDIPIYAEALMSGRLPVDRLLNSVAARKTWMAGTSPAMTNGSVH